MSVVAESLSKVILGAPQTHRNLSLFPLLGDEIGRASCRERVCLYV